VFLIRSTLWCSLTLAAFTVSPVIAQSPEAPFDQAKALAELRKAIEGKEDQLAVDVFMNVRASPRSGCSGSWSSGSRDRWV